MARVLQFIAWCFTQVWRWGWPKITAVVRWARANWQRLLSWISAGYSWYSIIEWILRSLGLL